MIAHRYNPIPISRNSLPSTSPAIDVLFTSACLQSTVYSLHPKLVTHNQQAFPAPRPLHLPRTVPKRGDRSVRALTEAKTQPLLFLGVAWHSMPTSFLGPSDILSTTNSPEAVHLAVEKHLRTSTFYASVSLLEGSDGKRCHLCIMSCDVQE